MSIDVKSMTFADIGESFTRIDADRTLILHGFLSKVGETPTYDAWESARKEWGQGYKRVKPAATDDAVNTVNKGGGLEHAGGAAPHRFGHVSTHGKTLLASNHGVAHQDGGGAVVFQSKQAHAAAGRQAF